MDVKTSSIVDDAFRAKVAALSELSRSEIALVCSDGGYFRGKTFRLLAPTPQESDLWFESICGLIQWNNLSPVRVSAMRRTQILCQRAYDSQTVQIGIAVLIMASFIATMAETQILPDDDSLSGAVFAAIGDFFNWIFTAELVVNICCKFPLDFVRDAWNWFDTFVVVSRFLLSSVKGGAQMLRCIRALRIFRLFKRVPTLLRLTSALLMSVPKVLNAFALVLILQSIYSILAVQFFADASPEDDCEEQGTCPDELFGSFSRAFFTMFQTATLDAWSDVARSLMRTTGQAALVAVFFISFLLIVTYTLMQVPQACKMGGDATTLMAPL